LPLDDVKNAYCQPLYFVDIPDVGLFRIVPSKVEKTESTNEITYECDHVLATLLDDVLFRYHQTDNLTTRENIEYLLEQQTVANWQLGACDFTRYFSYKWENENGLVGALFSITQPFDVPFEWTWDTSVYPWTLNLVVPASEVTCEIRYAKNLVEIERDIDPANVVNRIYPLGYGEGVNQLDITAVNGGVPYVENTTSIAAYGLLPYVWVDKRFENADSLKASAISLVNDRSIPKATYRVKAVDLSVLTGVDSDQFRCGHVVRVVDPDIGTFEARIVAESKYDMVGAPGDITLEIANKTEDIGSSQADIERKQQINELYAQGATNIDSHDYNDNADPSNPAVIRFYLPEEMVRVNKLNLTYETKEFRTYGKATQGGGATSTTTSGGGGTTATSSSGGGVSTSTNSGGGSTATSSGGGGTNVSSSNVDFAGVTLRTGIPYGSTLPPYELHEHLVTLADAALAHDHTVSIPSHTHTVSIPNHSHDFSVPNHSHSVTVPSHTHDFSIPNHTHDIQHGIYKLAQLPSFVSIKVDGNTVPYTATSGENIDLIPYLAIDTSGMVVRGWHTIEITPNDLGRITAQITTQFFIQSRGGGNY
jgi:phage minor structural protein